MTQGSPAELLQRALQLPADDRLALATEILDSVEGPEDPKWAAAWATELDRRVRELDAGTVKAIPWEQVRSETLERLRSKGNRWSLRLPPAQSAGVAVESRQKSRAPERFEVVGKDPHPPTCGRRPFSPAGPSGPSRPTPAPRALRARPRRLRGRGDTAAAADEE
jgi:putative addiction module component (TIGR02574 family)